MKIRFATEQDYRGLALMKWEHSAEDDVDYGEHNLDGVNQEVFIEEFITFLNEHKDYKIFVADEDGAVVSAMFVYVVPKVPKPNGNANSISYLTNVYTKKEYCGKGIGTQLLAYIKNYLKEIKCELMFVWPSDNSVNWYKRNSFIEDNEIFECLLCEE